MNNLLNDRLFWKAVPYVQRQQAVHKYLDGSYLFI